MNGIYNMSIPELFLEACKLDYEQSNGMIAVEKMHGPGFFPGCIGTKESGIKLDNFPVMVLGQDFDTVNKHSKIDLIKGEVDKNTTWRNLKKLLNDIRIDAKQCFFTNAYMGLRPNTTTKTKNTGASPAAHKSAEVFATQCHEFFKVQLRIIKPKLVLVLGKETAKFLCNAFGSSFEKWQNIDTLKKFYSTEERLYNDIDFEGQQIRFVFVIHPSLNGTNRSLIWGKEIGKEKEQEILKKWIKGFVN